MDDGLTGQTSKPKIVGIINVTPDSFSDGGQVDSVEAAVAQAAKFVKEGAAWVDVGGESTRPNAAPVSADVEVERIRPVVQEIHRAFPNLPISIDTSKPRVAQAAIEVGASIVNDVTACAAPGMAELCRDSKSSVVLMHMRGTPQTMQKNTKYNDLCASVQQYLIERARSIERIGVEKNRILLDPGLGFGKAPVDNFALIRAIPALKQLGYPVFVGASRKRFIGDVTGEKEAGKRVFGSVGAALAMATFGADFLRVHDVGATQRALDVYWKAVIG